MANDKHQQNGFSLVETTLILFLVTVVGFTGWFVWNARANNKSMNSTANQSTNTSDSKSLNVCKNSQPLKKTIFTINCPTNNSGVTQKFTISGNADGITNSGFQIYIDSPPISTDTSTSKQWLYVNPQTRIYSGDQILSNNSPNYTDSKGNFTINMDFSGNKVVYSRSAIVGGYKYEYQGISPGTHTITFNVSKSNCPVAKPGEARCLSVTGFVGPILTVNVK